MASTPRPGKRHHNALVPYFQVVKCQLSHCIPNNVAIGRKIAIAKLHEESYEAGFRFQRQTQPSSERGICRLLRYADQCRFENVIDDADCRNAIPPFNGSSRFFNCLRSDVKNFTQTLQGRVSIHALSYLVNFRSTVKSEFLGVGNCFLLKCVPIWIQYEHAVSGGPTPKSQLWRLGTISLSTIVLICFQKPICFRTGIRRVNWGIFLWILRFTVLLCPLPMKSVNWCNILDPIVNRYVFIWIIMLIRLYWKSMFRFQVEQIFPIVMAFFKSVKLTYRPHYVVCKSHSCI